MSHEIRTPLNGILGFTEVLLRDRGQTPADQQHEYLRTIRKSGQHLLALINDILDISKIEADQINVESIPCCPQQIIAEAVSVLRVGAMEKGIGLDYRWEGAIPKVIHTDPYRFKQLLLNLVGNAIKFTHQGAVLIVARIDRSADNPALVVEVSDTGIGIPLEKLSLIFQPFVQADDSVTRRYGGTGLGLAIGRKIAIALGGDLTASSVVGEGSTFTVRIAAGDLSATDEFVAPSRFAGADVRDHTSSTCDLNGLDVLVVDDGETNRKLIRLLVERSGAKVRTAENGQMALDLAGGAVFDVILMDMQMPVMDGYTATTTLRERGFAGPIIALTAHAMKGDRQKCEEAGCSGYLTKPIDAEQLLKALAECKAAGRSARRTDRVRSPMAGDVQPIRSQLPTHDDELRAIVSEFLDTLDDKLSAMQTAWDQADCDELAQLAHWLKGAGGTVGFGCFTDPATKLETLAKNRDLRQAQSALLSIRHLQHRLVL
jgi:CheY-like chemotaxis protein/HPt (histidine-containing phosphotransfer) domain-containing protein